MMGKTWAKVVGIFTILGGMSGVVALAEWLDLPDDWRFATVGFILGVMLILIPAIIMWDSPFRQRKLDREQKKEQLVQVLPSRSERLEELQSTTERLQVDIAKAETKMKTQQELSISNWRKGNKFREMAHDSAAKDAEHDQWLKQQELARAQEEYARVEKLTKEEWRSEQEAKIHVPE